jgi:hypothetical protein
MFREIELKTYKVEGIMLDYILRASLQPRGHLLAFMNDRNWEYIPFFDAELLPLAQDSRVGSMRKEFLSVNKQNLCLLSLLDPGATADVQIPIAHRSIIFHLGLFAVQGELHVTSDAPDEDLMDDLHDYFPVTSASIYPIRPIATPPTAKVPLMFISRPLIQAYQVLKNSNS